VATQQFEFLLNHPCGLRVQATLDAADAKAVDGVEIRDLANGYVWYRLPEAQIAGQLVAMSLCFFKGSLEWLLVAVVDRGLYGASWSDWSAQKEKARAQATAEWLEAIGYCLGTYTWGVVYAEIDPKTGDGYGGIRFAASTHRVR
jgi:hypothetical protein